MCIDYFYKYFRILLYILRISNLKKEIYNQTKMYLIFIGFKYAYEAATLPNWWTLILLDRESKESLEKSDWFGDEEDRSVTPSLDGLDILSSLLVNYLANLRVFFRLLWALIRVFPPIIIQIIMSSNISTAFINTAFSFIDPSNCCVVKCTLTWRKRYVVQ